MLFLASSITRNSTIGFQCLASGVGTHYLGVISDVCRDCTTREAREQEVSECLLTERELRASDASGFGRVVAALEEEGLRKEEQLQQLEAKCKHLEGKGLTRLYHCPSWCFFRFRPSLILSVPTS